MLDLMKVVHILSIIIHMVLVGLNMLPVLLNLMVLKNIQMLTNLGLVVHLQITAKEKSLANHT
jgi:hypothetical protein